MGRVTGRHVEKPAGCHRIATSGGLDDVLTRRFPPQNEAPTHGQELDPEETPTKRPSRRPSSARCRNGTSTTSIPASTAPRSSATSSRPTANAWPSSRPSRAACRRWRRARGRAPALAEAVKRYEALEDRLGRLISYASLVYAGNTTDPDARQVLRRHAGAHHRRLAASAVLHARTQPHRRCRARCRHDAIPRSAITGRGSRTCARRSPISSRTGSSSCSTRSRSPAIRPGTGNMTRPSRACASRSAASSSSIELALNLLQDADGKKRKAAALALAKTFKENLRPFTLITNTLAKDKEISDRWRGFKDVADARHLSNRVEPEVVEALVAAVRAAYPKLSHRYYALKAKWFGKKTAALLGPQRAAAQGRAAHDPLDATRAPPCSPPMARSRRRWRKSPTASSRSNWIDAPVRARQAAGRLRASDRAVGASLCAAQLPGQAARRDDARARARPRRASGAGGAQRPADGADAADAGRDRERVRRDAHLQEAAGRRPPTRSSARPCSPPRSRT